MADIVVIGSKNFCDGFQLAGISNFLVVENEEEANKEFNQLPKDNLGLIIAEYGFKLPKVKKPVVIYLSSNSEKNYQMIMDLEAECKRGIGGLSFWQEKS